LLHLEEIQQEIDIREYDMERVRICPVVNLSFINLSILRFIYVLVLMWCSDYLFIIFYLLSLLVPVSSSFSACCTSNVHSNIAATGVYWPTALMPKKTVGPKMSANTDSHTRHF